MNLLSLGETKTSGYSQLVVYFHCKQLCKADKSSIAENIHKVW